MRTILIVSFMSFLFIFGSLYLYVQRTNLESVADQKGSPLDAKDVDAAELSFAALETERSQLAAERQQILQLRQSVSLREAGIQQQLDFVQKAISELKQEQIRYGQARSESAQKLAKMFDAMKPANAAPIFKTLDRETALDILVRMKEKNAAKLLSAIDPGMAADLSTRLSLRGIQ